MASAHLAELDGLAAAYLGQRDRIEEISLAELARRLDCGDVVVLDVGPHPEFAAGHITGARSDPIDVLGSHVRSMPPDVEVVAYCRGRYCVLSHRAVRLLTEHGFDARLSADGMLEWQADGVPITTATEP